MQNGVTGLLVTDVSLAGGDVCEAIRRIRYHEIGDNPFVLVLVILIQSKVYCGPQGLQCRNG